MNQSIQPAPKSDEILQRLMALHPKLIDLSLDRMWRILDRLDDPHKRLPPVVHVAGTNGKGSVVAYLLAMFEATGYRVHTYTSPHLVRFAERVRLCGEIIDDDYWADLLARCEKANGDAPITFFEVTTAAAFLGYAECPADILLLETGLGGRLDATNVVERPAANVITPISLDHTQYLGPTVPAIAREKAGILRSGVPCIVSRQDPVPLSVLQAEAAKLETPLFRFGVEWQVAPDASGGSFVWRDENRTLNLPLPALVGGHQIDNAGTAIAVLAQLKDFSVPEAAIAAGLRGVEWPARLQRLTRGPVVAQAPEGAEIWLDGGHNAAAGEMLAAAMQDFAAADPEPRPCFLLVGMLNTKDPIAFLRPFAGLVTAAEAVRIPGEDASLSAEEVADAGNRAGLRMTICTGPDQAMKRIRDQVSGKPPPRILICGSLYLAGAILSEND